MRCAIVRPSIVESAVSEPLPGWLEGVKVAEPLILAYGLGKLAGFPMSSALGSQPPTHPLPLTAPLTRLRTSCLDVVPVDMVVNTLVGALWGKEADWGLGEEKLSCPGSPAQPLSTVSSVTRCSSSEEVEAAAGGPAGGSGRALQQYPLRDRRSGLLLKVDAPFKLYADTASFMREVEGGLPPRWLARLTGQLGRLDQGLAKLRRMTGLYTPYTFNQCSWPGLAAVCRFECSATEQLMAAVAGAGGEGCGLGWGLRELDWEQYITQVHVPGVRRYVLKQKEL
ncbi:hypothetical protein V8C86DRAFT_3028310 [Haematococcus lacustris]